MRILITGAAGFVGTHLLQDILDAGAQVVALHHRSDPTTLPRHSRLTWVRADLTTDSLPSLPSGIDTVIHLAAAFAPGTDQRVFDRLRPLNVDATDQLAAAASAAGVERFIFASSIAACEEGVGATVVEQNGWPVTAYGRSKLEAEHALQRRAGHRMQYIVLRATALFGEHHQGSVFELASAIKRRRFFTFGSGTNRVNFQYVKDYCDTLRSACCAERFPSGVYIAADRAMSLNDFANIIAVSLGASINKTQIPASLGLAAGACCDVLSRVSRRELPLSVRRVKAMLRDVEYSAGKLDSQLGRPLRYGVSTGLDRTISWFRHEKLL
jgi:nucleoside-diphosphate-sugar epimerase